MRIDLDQAAVARGETGGGEIEIRRIALPSRCHQHIGHRESRAGRKRERHVSRGRRIAPCHFFLPDKTQTARRHRALDVFGNFAIEKTEERVAPVNQMHLDAERSEDAGIFRPNHAGADHCQGLRQRADLENLVGIMDARMLKRKFRRTHG